VKTNVHIFVKVIYTSWSNALNTIKIFTTQKASTKVLLATVYVIIPTSDVIVH